MKSFFKRLSRTQKFLPRYCPNCGSDQRGNPIPRHKRHFYSSRYYWRTINVYDVHRDRGIAWRCPDCYHQWPKAK